MSSTRDPWLPLGDVHVSPSGRLESTVCLDPSSRWFSGHFDECAVVPGVAILAFVAEMVTGQGRLRGRRLEVSGFLKVRFRRVVFSEERLHVSVASMPPGPEADLPFDVTCDGESVAQGTLKVTEKRDEGTVAGAQAQDC